MGIPWQSSGWDSLLSSPRAQVRAWVQPLVRELGSRRCKKKKKKNSTSLKLFVNEYMNAYLDFCVY